MNVTACKIYSLSSMISRHTKRPRCSEIKMNMTVLIILVFELGSLSSSLMFETKLDVSLSCIVFDDLI